MSTGALHDWDLSPEQARDVQTRLASRVVREGRVAEAEIVVGLDVAYREAEGIAIAAASALNASTLAPLETRVIRAPSVFPYTPGLFSFTEAPPLIEAIGALDVKPGLLVCDGHGIAHPRRFGLASHIGLLLDLPTIGCAKTRLIGEYDMPGKARGSWTPLVDDGETVGAVVRTQDGVKPVYVSVGHLISLEGAIDWVLRLSPRYRLPETTRAADHAVRMAAKGRVVEAETQH